MGCCIDFGRPVCWTPESLAGGVVVRYDAGVAKKLFLETFGCQMNVLDSELVLGQLRGQGYESTDDRDAANVIVYNTCSVREHAEQKVWSRLGELRDRKRLDPSLVIGVIGCMAERDGNDLFRKFPHVDLLCGPGELDKLATLVHNAAVTSTAPDRPAGKQVALMGSTARRSGTLAAAEDHLELLDLSRSISAHDAPAQAYVRITRGCNKFCTYCVVPHTRGPEVHRPPQNIVDEVRRLAESGVREVTLLGQTINHYAHRIEGGRTTTFADLLYLVHEAAPSLARLRFVTSYPRDFTDAALHAMRDCGRICRYLHVPAQSGSDRILKAMNRGYTAGQYRDFIDRARSILPDVSLASDFIVGFPTETDAEFRETVELTRYGRFKNSFIFKYSPRPGTVAVDRFIDDVAEDVKRRRNADLLGVQAEVCGDHNRDMIGRTVQVLVEGPSKLAAKPAYPSSAGGAVELGWERRRAAPAVGTVQLVGRTRGDQVVVFDGGLAQVGQLVDVEVVDGKNLTLFAKAVTGLGAAS